MFSNVWCRIGNRLQACIVLSADFASLSQLGLFCEAARFHSIARRLAFVLGPRCIARVHAMPE